MQVVVMIEVAAGSYSLEIVERLLVDLSDSIYNY